MLVTLPGLCLCPSECHSITCSQWNHSHASLTGQVPDISHFLHFSFWDSVYYKVHGNEPDHKFPSQSYEKRGHWVGFADNKDLLRRYSLMTQQIITRSTVRSAIKTSPNLRLNQPEGEDQPQDLSSEVFVYGRPHPDGSEEPPHMSIISFDDLPGECFCFQGMRMGRENMIPSL